jgi:hypothetical protein
VSKFGKRIDGPADRRWLKRKRVGVPALAMFDDRFSGTLIQDLSMTGAQLRGLDLPEPSTRLALQVGDRSLTGEIMWAAGDKRGMRLDFARK